VTACNQDESYSLLISTLRRTASEFYTVFFSIYWGSHFADLLFDLRQQQNDLSSTLIDIYNVLLSVFLNSKCILPYLTVIRDLCVTSPIWGSLIQALAVHIAGEFQQCLRGLINVCIVGSVMLQASIIWHP
jgi:hypothetical protein